MEFITILVIAMDYRSIRLPFCFQRCYSSTDQLREGISIALFLPSSGIDALIGWGAGKTVVNCSGILTTDRFILLAVLGVKMIYESFGKEGEKLNPLQLKVRISMAIAPASMHLS
jgi:putative Mn2+ efflux pump MntP